MKTLAKIEGALPKDTIFDPVTYKLKEESLEEFKDLLDREGDLISFLM